MKYHLLYNPASDNGRGREEAENAEKLLTDGEVIKQDIKAIDKQEYIRTQTAPDDIILVCGGDGTLSHFVNSVDVAAIGRRIDYYATGTGNDFFRDLGLNKGDIAKNINEYITDLPRVTVKGKTYRFFNGVGFGIDGYCCEVGDRMRAEGHTKINYAGIAIKGLLFHFKPVTATVTIDGKTAEYKKVWLAPTMKGHFYGGGMMPVPTQDRCDKEGKVSVFVWHGSGKLKTLPIFPGIFKGEHLKHGECWKSFAGKTVHIKFDRPCALQIDGETISGVEEYSVEA